MHAGANGSWPSLPAWTPHTTCCSPAHLTAVHPLMSICGLAHTGSPVSRRLRSAASSSAPRGMAGCWVRQQAQQRSVWWMRRGKRAQGAWAVGAPLPPLLSQQMQQAPSLLQCSNCRPTTHTQHACSLLYSSILCNPIASQPAALLAGTLPPPPAYTPPPSHPATPYLAAVPRCPPPATRSHQRRPARR